MKRLLFTLLVSVNCILTFAVDIVYEVDGIFYIQISETEAKVTFVSYPVDYEGEKIIEYAGDIVIPSQKIIGGKTLTITEIGAFAFKDNDGLTSVTIPNTVKKISMDAFRSCDGIASITIPASVTNIGEHAFMDSSIKTVNLEDGEDNLDIYYNAFEGCHVESLYMGRQISGQFFRDDTSLNTLTIGSGVKSLSDFSFMGCTSLTSLTIPNTVNKIGNNSFKNCGIKTLIIEEGTESLSVVVQNTGDNSFTGCPFETVYLGRTLSYSYYSPFMGITTINSVTIGKNVSLIGQYGFMGCTSLKNLMIEDGTELLTFETFSDIIVPFKDSPIETMHLGRNITYNSKGVVDYYSPFEKKTSLTTLTIGNNVTFIPAHAFSGCTGLTSLVIPSSIMLLNIGSFVKCTGLTSLTLEDSTNPLDIHGYVTLSSLRTLYLGRNVDEYLCQDNQNLTTLTIGDKVTEIPACAFSGCTGLQSLTIPSSVTSIGRSAFNHCSAITSLTIPQNVISIGENAFSDWANLSSLTFEDCDKPLNCSGSFKTSPIKTLYLGRDVEEFAKGSLESLTIGNKVTKINDYMFYGCDGLQTLTIPDGVTSIGEFAFGMCGFSSIDIGTGVSSIGEDAFTACSNLSKVNISDVSAWCNINFENVGANPCTFSQNLYLNNEEISELVIPEGVTKICKYAFYNCPFKTVTIPSSVNTIEYYAFANMSEMTDMYCYPETVPTTDTDAFSGSWVENDVLHVPSVSIDNYKSCSPWNEFGTIYVIGAENAITITAYNLSMEYGETVPVLTYKTEGGKLNGQPTLSCDATSKSPVGTYTITVSKGTVTNDNVIYVNGILTIVEASLNITAKSYTIKQGEALPEFEAEYSGFRNDETSDVLTKKPVMTTTATSASSPGTYDIEISGAEATNYDITYTKGKLTIVDADAVIVTANSYTRIYGEANPTFAYTSSGATLSGVPEITCEATATSPVGTYPIIIKKGSVTNYNDSYVNGTLTITKAPLTITAKNYTIKQGEALPDFEAEYSGFRNDETSDVLTMKPVMTTAATSASSPGTYDIEISGAEATNYDITYTKGKLTIVDADAVIVTANSYTRVYGDANPTFAYTSSGATLSGVPEITCEATATSPVSTYPIIIKKGSVTNYNDSYINGTLTITKAPLTITAKSYTIRKGDDLPEMEIIYEGFKNNETEAVLSALPQVSCVATKDSAPGEYAITLSGAEAQNYEISLVAGKLTILAPPEPEPIIIEENGAIFSKNDDNTISIIGSDGIGEIYEIPAMVDCDGVECTVTVIGEFAFKDNSGLTQVTIPSTIEFIARGAFAGCINLATIYVYAIDPITIEGVGARTRSSDDNVFTGVNLETCILYVPKGCVEKYRVDKGWSIFKNILEIGGTGVNSVSEEDKSFDVFNIRGEKVRHAATSLEGLPKGIYIVNGKKIVK